MLPVTSPPKNILIIKPSAIGDVVHTLPILNLLRIHWPQSKISWLVTPACAGLLRDHPQLDEVILFERRRFGQGWRDPRAAAGLFSFSLQLRRRKFDLVLDLQGLFRSAFFAWASGAPIRVGFANAREGAPVFYTDRIPIQTPDSHAIDRYLQLVAALGCPTSPIGFHFPTTDADRQRIASLVPAEPFAVLLPGTNWLTKRWPAEHFAQLATLLRERHNLKIVLAGGPGEEALAAGIPADTNLIAKTSLRELVALLERTALIVANDSGPMHIAAAFGRPLVTLFGPTNPLRTGPYQRSDAVTRIALPCSPCYSRTCSHISCMRWLTPAMAATMASEQLHRAK